MSIRYFTSECVTKGHPDKIADQISDAILDSLLKEDPSSRCACEVTVEKDYIHIMGEVTSKAVVDYERVVRDTVASIGYTDSSLGFSDKSELRIKLNTQSPDISMGVDSSYDEKDQGAGDQGIMFGYAVAETEEFMPLSLVMARELTDALSQARESGLLPYLRPDGKSQVTVEYRDGRLERIDAVVVSTQHSEEVSLESLRSDIEEKIIRRSRYAGLMDEKTKIFINPTGRFVLGGPAADTGLTGRKIIVDTYGGKAHHGGGAFSGKDSSKVDRSASYALRNVAKTIVASGICYECELQVSYAIGVSRPISLYIDTFGTSKVDEDRILEFVNENFDLRPRAIIERYGLRSPIFSETARRGHFGIKGYPWEEVDPVLIEKLKALL